MGPRHSLSNVDAESRKADCEACGPGTAIRTCKGANGKHYWRCRRPFEQRATPEARQRWRTKNKDKRREQKFGLTPGQYDEMLAEQQGVCAICKQPSPSRALAVDHDHQTGAVRGLLCTGCNVGLGNFRDDTELLARAQAYLTGVAGPRA